MTDHSIKIAGGGISGLTAAINLAKAGRRVEVYEKRREIGGRFLGDWQGIENWTTKEDLLREIEKMNLSARFDFFPLPKVIASDGNRTFFPRSKRPLCYLVKRGPFPGSLDQSLKTQALEAGATIFTNQSLPVEKADINATGPNGREVFAVDKGIAFDTSMPDMAIVIASDPVGFKGYAYLLVADGYGCLCTVLFDRFKRIDPCFQKAQELIGNLVDLDIQNPRKVGGLGGFILKKNYQPGKTLLTGEAAGLQDMLWGFGIRIAMQSGYLAAQSIIHGKDYSSLIRKKLINKVKASAVNRLLYEKLGQELGYGFVLRLTAGNPYIRWFLRIAHRYTWVHRMLFPATKALIERNHKVF